MEILNHQYPLESRLAMLTACSGYSFSSIKNSNVIREGLTDTLKRLNSKAVVPESDKGIRNLVVKFGGRVKEAIKETIRQKLNSGEHFSCCFDEWTSVSGRRYINICVEDKSGSVFNLGLVRIVGKANADNILRLVTQRLQDFAIDSTKHIAFTTDGCTVMQKIHQNSGIESQLCIVHGIHLAVVDILYDKKKKQTTGDSLADLIEPEEEESSAAEELSDISEDTDVEEDEDEDEQIQVDKTQDETNAKEFDEFNEEEHDSGFKVEQCGSPLEFESTTIKSVISKVRKLATHFRRSPKDNDILQNIITEKLKLPRGLKLILDCRTRWSSLYNMLDRYYKLRKAVDEAVKETKIQIKISTTEKCMIRCLLKTLQPIALTVKVLCRRDSNLLKARAALKLLFQVLEGQKNPLSNALVAKLRATVQERWTINSSAIYYLQTGSLTDSYAEESIALDEDENDDEDDLSPFYKSLFPNLEDKNTESVEIAKVFEIHSKADIKEHLMRLIDRVCPLKPEIIEPVINSVEAASDTPPLKRAKLSFEDQLNQAVLNVDVVKKVKKTNTRQSEISKALTAEMTFHEKNIHRNSYLEKCYQMLLCIKPTSIESERAFSDAGALCTKVRSRFNDQAIDILAFLRHALRVHENR